MKVCGELQPFLLQCLHLGDPFLHCLVRLFGTRAQCIQFSLHVLELGVPPIQVNASGAGSGSGQHKPRPAFAVSPKHPARKELPVIHALKQSHRRMGWIDEWMNKCATDANKRVYCLCAGCERASHKTNANHFLCRGVVGIGGHVRLKRMSGEYTYLPTLSPKWPFRLPLRSAIPWRFL